MFQPHRSDSSVISLSLAAIGLIIPTVFHRAADRTPGGWSPLVEQKLSLGIAVVMFLTYFCMLAFSLRTHKDLFRGAGEREGTERQWSRSKAVIILLIATAFVALLSEFLVGTIESVRDSVGLTEVFVGVIVVAIVGNAAEHSTAILMAMKDKMDLSFGIAIGSSLQIALFVAPVLIFLSYAFGRPMDLEFTLPEVVAVVVSVYILFQISSDGETNWIEGIQLLSLYLILGILFFYLPAGTHRTLGLARFSRICSTVSIAWGVRAVATEIDVRDGRPFQLQEVTEPRVDLRGASLRRRRKKRTFDRQEENRCGDVDAEFDAEKRGRRREIDVVICAELFDPR